MRIVGIDGGVNAGWFETPRILDGCFQHSPTQSGARSEDQSHVRPPEVVELRYLQDSDIDDLAIGAAILGTGGGGHPYIGKLLAREAIRLHGPVTIVDVDDVPDDAVAVSSANMGAPTVLLEKLPQGDETLRAFLRLQEHMSRRITHLVPLEAGGNNSTTPITVAAKVGLPVVDGDFMGRAFPELQMVTASIFGLPASPMVLSDDKGNLAVVEGIDNLSTERLARSITVAMGGIAMIALYVMTGKQLKQAAIPATLRLAQELGRLVRESHAARVNPVEAVVGKLNGFIVFTGRVQDVDRRTEGGFARGTVSLGGLQGDSGSTMRIDFQNEYLVATRDGEIAVSVPDLIIVLDLESGQPITTAELRFGLRVAVIATSSDARWQSPAGLALVGPRSFGYEFDYVPLPARIRRLGLG